MEWEKVMDYEIDGRIKPAKVEVEKIYDLAKKDKNEPQIIKTFFFLSRYSLVLEEDATSKILHRLKEEKENVSIPTKAILESVYAETLEKIYKNLSYKILKRTAIDVPTPENIKEWGGENFRSEIDSAYQRSIKHHDILYKIPLQEYSTIVEINTINKRIGRSLYDFLVWRYLESITNNQFDSYKLDKTLLFKNTPQFLEFKTNDNYSYSLKKSIELLQDLEKHYYNQKGTLGQQRAILKRLEFLDNKFYNSTEYEETYLKTLKQCTDSWKKESFFKSQAKLKQIALLKKLANKNENKKYLTRAVTVCNDIILNAKDEDVIFEAKDLKLRITDPLVKITTEDYVIPNKSILAKVKYKNTDSINIKIYRVHHNNSLTHKIFNNFAGTHPPLIEKNYVLPNNFGHFEYETEIILPPLTNGKYLASIEPYNKNTSQDKRSFFVIQATQITYLYKDDIYTILDITNGKPIKRAKIISNDETFYTDRKGRAKIEADKLGTRNDLIIHKKDTIDNRTYQYKDSYNNDENEDDEEIEATTNIYFDRAIYRPEQTVYFKGIVTQKTQTSNKKLYSVVPDIYVTVEVEDSNSNTIEEMRLKTNKFGSFTGEFKLPRNIMTGRFSINIEEDYDYDDDYSDDDEHPFWDNENLYFNEDSFHFRVEEYKRPTFEASFLPFKDVVKVNDSITVTGKAKAFNGAPVSNATIKYTISRRTENSYNTTNFSLPNGEVITDNKGNFKITFLAVPDIDINPEELPIFNFNINCEITDITGETHDCSTNVRVGYHALELTASIPTKITPESKSFITIATQNLNGQFTPAKCDIKIYKLKNSNNRLLRSRPWSQPEIQTISKSEFINKFPHIPYGENYFTPTLPKETIFQHSIVTEKDYKLNINDYKNWDTGNYELLVTTKDSVGNIFEEKKLFTVRKEKGISGLHIMKYNIENTDYKNDGYITLQLYTALPELYVNIEAIHKNTDSYYKNYKLTKGSRFIKIPFNKKWKKTVSIVIDYVWENEYQEERFNIDASIAIQPITFQTNVINNKLLPGKNETWSFTLKNSNKLPAEVLASMYDASLDDFATKHWIQLINEYNSYNYIGYKTIGTKGLFNTKYIHNYISSQKTKKYIPSDKLKTYNFSINHQSIGYYYTETENRKYSHTGTKGNGTAPSTNTFILSGTVADKIGPLPGAPITVRGTTRSVQSDIDGNFSITVSLGEVIEISYISYQTQVYTVGLHTSIEVMLREDANKLEAVVKTGYRSTTKRKNAAAVTTISVESVEDRCNGNLLQSLQGQVAGLSIATGSGEPGSDDTIILRGVGTINGNVQPLFVVDGVPMDEDSFRSFKQSEIASYNLLKDAAATSIYGSRGANGVIVISTKKGVQEQMKELEKVESRKNLQETAFFHPQIKTDKEGNFNFSFTSPEALTQWKLRLFAHNKKAQSGYFEYLAFTQKDLMIMPNMPRFLREGDEITITAKVTNMTTDVKSGNAMLQLYDASTMERIDNTVLQTALIQSFNLTAKSNTTVSWKIKVPLGIQGIQYKIAAKSGDFSDGEESIIPVLSNRILVTESIPLWVKGNTTKQYTLENLKNNTSSTLIHHGITLEYTSNPAWIALQSLPYLMEFEHECAEQVFSRYYANAIATHIIDSTPKVATFFESWRKKGKPTSKLTQNEELKSIIMSESPWMLDVQSDDERKNRIALLFELDKMKITLKANLNKLDNKQMQSGGFPWFEGGDESEYITRHVMAGLGHLNKLGITSEKYTIDGITKTGVQFIDKNFIDDYERLIEMKREITNNHTSLHYLYTRSFYLEQYPLDSITQKITKRYTNHIKKNWLQYSLYQKGMAALVLQRFNEVKTAKKIIQSLRDTSASNEEFGMYWINNKAGWYWYNSPIETQALLIEAFTEIDNDTEAIDAMKVWLIKNKQNKNWPTTKSTTEAVYALMMTGSDWLSIKDNTTITLGDKATFAKKMEQNEIEAETGYIKLHWQGKEVTKEMADLTIENKTKVPGYGGLYWQYFEDTDKVKTAQKGLMNIRKELFIKTNTIDGVKLKKVSVENPMKIGNTVTMQLVLEIKEDMEYVHLKDVRAAAFEPVDVISGYEYSDGLGYYRSTRDVATHFFFDRINKGTYVLEYDVRVNNVGEFSNGISTIQSMYAPEFSGHSEGMKIKTKE
ncbi:MAG: hypothetical protein BM557_07280 [Flavobacterium sp. MedPE-SWcel]|nr:MAG: hypothetical protein BM557_07280 [Flavobacterium sp. MedPE-SWcel]